MTQVFISYSRRDLAFVEGLAADLQAAGLDVWYDLSGLEGGQRWSREIEKAIRESQYVLVVLSPDSVSSKWVEEEFLYASELNKKIVPLFYRQCSLPFGYRTLHFINVQGINYKRNFNEILRTLGVKPVVTEKPSVPVREKPSTVKPEEKPKVVPGPEPKKANLKVNPRAVVGLFGLAAIVVAGIFGFPYMAEKLSNQPEATATATRTARPFNATEAAFISKVAPTQAPQTATSSALLTKVAIADTRIETETQLPFEITDNYGVEMVLVPEGEFIMGGSADDAVEYCSLNHKWCTREYFIGDEPPHSVYLKAYYIDKNEVTNGLYSACVEAGVCKQLQNSSSYTRASYYGNPKFDNYPVINVDWNMASTYCNWRQARLPTEAEWEKAARSTDERIYAWGNNFECQKGNFLDSEYEWKKDNYREFSEPTCDGYLDTTPVGQFEGDVSPYGVYDMTGNVEEWVADWYSDNYYSLSPTTNPLGPESGKHRVIRGGSWDYSFYHSYYRSARLPTNDYYDVGFRCAKNATP